MDLTPLDSMMAKFRAWRECEAAAQQDVEDAEALAVAADLRVAQAKRALRAAQYSTAVAQQAIVDFIIDNSAPVTDYTSIGGCDCQ